VEKIDNVKGFNYILSIVRRLRRVNPLEEVPSVVFVAPVVYSGLTSQQDLPFVEDKAERYGSLVGLPDHAVAGELDAVAGDLDA
jgi:hypothetical protein